MPPPGRGSGRVLSRKTRGSVPRLVWMLGFAARPCRLFRSYPPVTTGDSLRSRSTRLKRRASQWSSTPQGAVRPIARSPGTTRTALGQSARPLPAPSAQTPGSNVALHDPRHPPTGLCPPTPPCPAEIRPRNFWEATRRPPVGGPHRAAPLPRQPETACYCFRTGTDSRGWKRTPRFFTPRSHVSL